MHRTKHLRRANAVPFSEEMCSLGHAKMLRSLCCMLGHFYKKMLSSNMLSWKYKDGPTQAAGQKGTP